jgi:CheY-like chemotaxis protein
MTNAIALRLEKRGIVGEETMFSLFRARDNDRENGPHLVAAQKLEPAAAGQMPRAKGLIVIVEGDGWRSGPLTSRLGHAGYAVQVVPGQKAALDLLQRQHPALLIVGGEADLRLYRALRQASPAPIMALAPWSDEGQMLEAFAAGVDDYQTAPIGSTEVVARAGAMVRRSGMPLRTRAESLT